MKKLTILLTGASRGIGLATAQILAKQGHKLALFSNESINYILKDKMLSKAQKSGTLTYGLMDVRSIKDWDHAIEQTVSAFGKVDVLINNAGILESGELANSDLDRELNTIDINCKGALIGCQKIVSHMQISEYTKIINLSSASAIYGQPEIANYSATKFYIRGLTEALNIEYCKLGIKVIDIMPLWVSTDMTKDLSVKSISKLGIRLTPQDVAKSINSLIKKPNIKVKKTHYPIGIPALILNNMAQLTPNTIIKKVNSKISS